MKFIESRAFFMNFAPRIIAAQGLAPFANRSPNRVPPATAAILLSAASFQPEQGCAAEMEHSRNMAS